MGDIVVKLFYQVRDSSLLFSSTWEGVANDSRCPKSVENFTVHCKNGYYVASLALLKVFFLNL